MKRPKLPQVRHRRDAADTKPVPIELPISEYGKKFSREQNILLGIFILSTFGFLTLQGWLQTQLLRWFDWYFAGGFSWLVVAFGILLEVLAFYRSRLKQIEKSNRFPVDHLIVYRLKGGKLDFHIARKDVKLIEEHPDGTKTWLYSSAFRAGKLFERLLVRCNPDFAEHVGIPDAEEDVFIGWMSIRKPVTTLAVKEVGEGLDGIPIVRVVDSQYYRQQDTRPLMLSAQDVWDSTKAEDRWEAHEFKGKLRMEKMAHNTTEELRREAVRHAEEAKDKAQEQGEVLEEDEAKKPRLSPAMKYFLVVLFTVLITLGLAALIPGV